MLVSEGEYNVWCKEPWLIHYSLSLGGRLGERMVWLSTTLCMLASSHTFLVNAISYQVTRDSQGATTFVYLLDPNARPSSSHL
jgi:hypothetical protein